MFLLLDRKSPEKGDLRLSLTWFFDSPLVTVDEQLRTVTYMFEVRPSQYTTFEEGNGDIRLVVVPMEIPYTTSLQQFVMSAYLRDRDH